MWPKDNLTEDVFNDPMTEKVSDGWPVFGKMKKLIKDIIASIDKANGVVRLDENGKIPIAYMPKIPVEYLTGNILIERVEGDIPTSMIEGKINTSQLTGDIEASKLTGTINDNRLSDNVAFQSDLP
jgi:hypothetical protein